MVCEAFSMLAEKSKISHGFHGLKRINLQGVIREVREIRGGVGLNAEWWTASHANSQ